MNLDHFGMDTITLAGPLEAKLKAVREAGFTQIMLNATDIVGHPDGEAAAVTSKGSRDTCTPTRSTWRRRCSRCAARSTRACS
jgi:hypothetical protein